MSEEIQHLEERLRGVEGHIKMLLGGAAALAICALAFLGIEYWRIPRAVQAAVGERIDHTTLQRITEANTLAENLIKNSKNSNQWDPVKRSGFLLLGDTLICYGNATMKIVKNSHTADFSIDFAQPFEEAPSISHAIHTNTNGEFYDAYKFYPDPKKYAGRITSSNYQNQENTVTISYIAVGRPVNKSP